ncbi:MAG: WHG domain-containing protein, partial [Rhodospirillales bacterium]|nr:WHG domain-containing protein [Rhodospirillales bacterium]
AAAAPGPATRMRALVSAYWQFAETNPELYAVMFGLDGVRCPDHLGEDAVGQSLRACAAELVDKRSLEYNARDLGDLIAAVLHGFVALMLSNCFDGGSVRARDLLMAAIEELLRGLSRR